ncbi:MAG: hypothetical protein ACI9FB_004572 [Candidatus Azotimanducaceae bacterium]|jgi:hypothetical protein
MMNDNDLDDEIQKKIDQAKKDMAEKGRNYDGLGDAIEKDGYVGTYFGPRNDIEKQRLINAIRKLDSQ